MTDSAPQPILPGRIVHPSPLRARTRLGKYRLVRRIGNGGFATVFEAVDTVLGIPIALKVHQGPVTRASLANLRREAQLHARLDHPNILPIHNAELIDGRLITIHPLGERSLAERMLYRMSTERVLDYGRQILEAVAHAHRSGVIHCDLKPDNFILFSDNRLCLSDFGISRVARRTVRGSGSGTVGYIAPEQAMGRTSFRSDVFSLGLILYEMLTCALPEWPFEWPFPGSDRLRRKVPEDFVRLLRKTLAVAPRTRYADARTMLIAFGDLVPKVEAFTARQRRRRRAR